MSKILLLEDDVSLVERLRCSLKQEGYGVNYVRTVHRVYN